MGRILLNSPLFDIRSPWISWGLSPLRDNGAGNFIEVAQKENIFQKALDKVKLGAYNTTYKLRILNFLENILNFEADSGREIPKGKFYSEQGGII